MPRRTTPAFGQNSSDPMGTPAPAQATPKDAQASQASAQQAAGPSGPLPAITLPKGGGAIHGMGEKFSTNPVTGTASFSIPVAASPGRSGFGPQLSLSYDSGAGNGPFGWGISLSLPAITRRTDKGLPQYDDTNESDVFILSGAEDLVPVLSDGERHEESRLGCDGKRYRVQRYRPRTEGLFARIERWTDLETGIAHWRSISKDNIKTLYGQTASARIADPNDAARIFIWLLEESRDDKGNVIVYEYKPEDAAGVDRTEPAEQSRLQTGACFSQRYIKRIRYGNRLPFAAQDFLFEVVFDYGEHHDVIPRPAEEWSWPARLDAFSSYRSGFEVRSYRLCRRVLMFHHFPELGPEPCLVRSTDLDYGDPSPIATFIRTISQVGYVRSKDGRSYCRAALPPVELSFSQAQIDETLRDLDAASLENLPQGVGGSGYTAVDLHGEGLPGILTEQAGTLFYKPNRGDGSFGPMEVVIQRPLIEDAVGRTYQLTDVDGDGRDELVRFQPPAGFYQRAADDTWGPYTPFQRAPNLNWNDPNLRSVDLTGDGLADVLVAGDDGFTWWKSLGLDGFAPAEHVYLPLDEEHGPRLIFADGTSSIYLADMSGDGLVDLVRIRNGEVYYWPNLGYGHFGAKITMASAPQFDHPEQFDQQRIRLADVDGSGVTDILYLGRDRVRIYFNQSGNGWSAPAELTALPPIDDNTHVAVFDLLGRGTACLVFSSALPGEARRPSRYVDLMASGKPHLLTKIANNLGAETHVRYAASTQFYLEDLRAGKPWITRLPFPVHVVERVETYDAIGRSRFVSRYAYHHGYYDGVEREFRGFGAVDQWDTEEFAALQSSGILPPADNDRDSASHIPPVRTRTWFHTGAYLDAGAISRQYEHEYYRPSHQSEVVFQASLLPDTILPAALSLDEEREACRALRGSVLRHEIYAEDGSPNAGLPYSVSESNYTLEVLQHRACNRHAVFFAHPRESISVHFERNPEDPRIGHEVVLEVDSLGNVRRAAAIGYGRQRAVPSAQPDPQEQTCTLITCTENDYTNGVDLSDCYRAPLPAEMRSFELTGLEVRPGQRLTFAELASATRTAEHIAYESTPTRGLQKRLIERQQTLYRRDDLSGPLPLGQLGCLALPYESYKQAFTPGLLKRIYRDRITASTLLHEGYYAQLPSQDGFWIPSGRTFLSPNEQDTSAEELAHAQQHFFLPVRAQDPFGQITTVAFDPYDLMPRQARDPLGNQTSAAIDYRVLQPWLVTDPNQNRAAVQFDALGMIIASSVMGKAGRDEGDTLEDPTTRIEYSLFAWLEHRQPAYVRTFAREQHGASNPRWQESYTYSDGFGREIQKKLQAEPGPLTEGGPSIPERWIGSGWTVFNNKGKPVRQYEPFFSATPAFEFARRVGVSPILFYDPLDRVVATLHPNHTYEKVVFDPWQQTSWDVNDTALQEDPRQDPDVGEYFQRLSPHEFLPTWYTQRKDGSLGRFEKVAAQKTAVHANTPSVAHFDALGRTFLTVTQNRFVRKDVLHEEAYATRVVFDMEGNQREVIDAKGRIVMRYDYDMLGSRVHQASMEAGERLALNDVAGKPIYSWDSRGHTLRTTYDALRRPLGVYLREREKPEILVEKTTYGESVAEPEAKNLRGKPYQAFDGAGVVTNPEYDFKGNLLRTSRQLAVEYKITLDWSIDVPLEPRIYETRTTFDALNRQVSQTTPDGSISLPIYNEANLMERLSVHLRGAAEATQFVKNVDYNAKGQRVLIEYGNRARTTHAYDPQTFRLTHLHTTRPGPDSELQDLHYTYDPTGNITHIQDDAQQTIYFRNRVVEPSNDYTYDAIYRLIEATGREHLGQIAGGGLGPIPTSWNDSPRVGLPHPGDGNAMGRYLERYTYDEVGNILEVLHRGTDPTAPGWMRKYAYEEVSLLELDKRSNRLSSTRIGDDMLAAIERYEYDEHGNMVRMPHLPVMEWDYRDRLQVISRNGNNNQHGEKVYCKYQPNGERIRKVRNHIEKHKDGESIYLNNFESHLMYCDINTPITISNETLHVMATNCGTDIKEQLRIAIVEAIGNEVYPELLYQIANQISSVTLELNSKAKICSHEEYYPYGVTSYQAENNKITTKRFRYTGKERDNESGLNYHQARYYASWIGLWISSDPVILISNEMNEQSPHQDDAVSNNPAQGLRISLYSYAADNPIKNIDPNGQDPATIPVSLSVDGSVKNQIVATAIAESDVGQEILIAWIYYNSIKWREKITTEQIKRRDPTALKYYYQGQSGIDKYILTNALGISSAWKEPKPGDSYSNALNLATMSPEERAASQLPQSLKQRVELMKTVVDKIFSGELQNPIPLWLGQGNVSDDLLERTSGAWPYARAYYMQHKSEFKSGVYLIAINGKNYETKYLKSEHMIILPKSSQDESVLYNRLVIAPGTLEREIMKRDYPGVKLLKE